MFAYVLFVLIGIASRIARYRSPAGRVEVVCCTLACWMLLSQLSQGFPIENQTATDKQGVPFSLPLFFATKIGTWDSYHTDWLALAVGSTLSALACSIWEWGWTAHRWRPVFPGEAQQDEGA
jgi:hypothetical protein